MGKPFMVAVLALASSAAIAQVRPDAGQVLEQTREPLRLPPPREADVLPRPPDPKPALPVQPDLRVNVTGFTFTGNTIYSEAFLQSVVAEYVGKQLNFDDLIEAATQVRAYYRERGYFLAQAYLPEQTIRDGQVQIGIIEGRIGEIEIVRRPATRLREGLYPIDIGHEILNDAAVGVGRHRFSEAAQRDQQKHRLHGEDEHRAEGLALHAVEPRSERGERHH